MRLTPALRNWLMALVAVMLGAVVMGVPTSAEEPAAEPPGGTDTSQPATDSQVTVSGRGAFADLQITVNQTRSLTNQAVSLAWTGGDSTIRNGQTSFAGNFLQIMQCWGEDDGRVPENPGPPPEQCVAGATTATYEGVSGNSVPGNLATRRQISLVGDETYDPSLGYVDEGGNVWREFHAVDGTVISKFIDNTFNPLAGAGNYWLNPYFDINTTNEVSASASGQDGSGIELFQLLTGVQSSGLGCGQRVQQAADGVFEIPKCWLVVVPRATAEVENAGTLYESNAVERGVATSPLSEAAWANRIAIPIEFNPVDSPCNLSDLDRRIAGSELAAAAVASWQPLLCGSDKPPYSYAPVSDTTARQILSNPQPGSAGMVAISRPLPPELLNDLNPLVYAPITASGLAIGFNVERIPSLSAPPEAEQFRGVRVAKINLTPRLVAKLLTQSYRGQVNIVVPPDYEWATTNPLALDRDPDFRQFNEEFEQLLVADPRLFSGLQLPAGTSDAAGQVWEWILADPEAAAWMAGAPDEWGMQINPLYATDAAANPTGFAFGEPTPQLFPKSDPYCYEAPPNSRFTPPARCGTDWMPYARSFDETAIRVRAGADGAKVNLNPFALTQAASWSRAAPQVVGRRAIMALTDTPSASRYGLQVARLSRAGDNGSDREFIAPDETSLGLGLTAMAPANEPQVLEPNPVAEVPGAYPLTMITYAAATPLTLDDTAREEYAAFLDYAAGAGQQPGLELGQLPRGYVPLPEPLLEQTRIAGEIIRTLELVLIEPPVTTQPATTPTTVPTPQPPTVIPPTVIPPTAIPPTVVPQPSPVQPSSSGGTNSNRTSSGQSSSRATTTTTTTTTSAPVKATVADTTPETTTAPVATTGPPAAAIATPGTGSGPGRAAVPVLGGMMLASALGALELTKRPRRAAGPKDPF